MSKKLIVDKETGATRWIDSGGSPSLPCGQGFKKYEYNDSCNDRGRLTEDPPPACGETRSEKKDITDR